MSKGLGVRQRAILDALAALRPGRAIDLHDLMPENYTDAQYRSTLHAAKTLADAGKVVLVSGSAEISADGERDAGCRAR